MRVLFPVLLLAALASAETVKITNAADCAKLPAEKQGLCASGVRYQQGYYYDTEAVSVAPVNGTFAPVPQKSLEERAVIAQEKSASSLGTIAIMMTLTMVVSLVSTLTLIIISN